MSEIKVIKGNITTLAVDAIVNAANKTLLGGAGVDGAIHAAAGPQLRAACQKLNGCKTGQAKLTHGYRLPAKYVIHTVGPRYFAKNASHDAVLLKACYQNSLNLAQKQAIHSIAFPAISTGVYHYPPKQAAEIAIKTVSTWITNHPNYEMKVILCAYDKQTASLYQNLLNKK